MEFDPSFSSSVPELCRDRLRWCLEAVSTLERLDYFPVVKVESGLSIISGMWYMKDNEVYNEFGRFFSVVVLRQGLTLSPRL